MGTFRARRPLALLLALLAAATLITVVHARPALAAGVAPLAPVQLHPDGRPPFEQYRRSPVTFSARAADGDTGAVGARLHYVVQRRLGTAWATAADRLTVGPIQVTLPDAATRWRVRFEASDQTVGPWTAWISFTVDSRVPAAPSVSIPDGPVTVGVPVPVTITSTDGVASTFYLSGDGTYPSGTGGQDPCGLVDFACLPTGATRLTVPWTFLREGFPRLSVNALGRGGTVSAATEVDPGLVQPDDAALTAATRWIIPAAGGGAATVAEVHGGPGLRIGRTLDVTTQQVAALGQTVDVPSATLGPTTSVRTTVPVVDTSSTFSVGAVLRVPTGSHGDLTVLNAGGDGGPAFSLVLTASSVWRFCVTTASGTGCSSQAVDPFSASAAVVGRYDTVRQLVSVAVGRAENQGVQIFTVAPARPVSRVLRFGGPALPRTTNYTGPIGSPFVAGGWVSARQLTTLLAGAV